MGDEGSIRLDAESLDLSGNLEAFSGPQHRSVCIPPILPAPTLFQLETRSPGGSHGCLPSGLEGAESLCEPSWNLIARVLKKVEEQAVDLVLVAPVWPSQPWYPKLLSLLIAQPLRILDLPEEVMHQVWEGLLPEITPPLAVWHISGNTMRTKEFQEKQRTFSCLHGIKNHPNHTIHSVKVDRLVY